MPLYDAHWLDAQYNARAASPEHPALFQRWAQQSAAARAQVACQVDLRYGEGPNQTADWFPAEQLDAPVLVFIHGGFWRSSDKASYSFIAPPFTAAGVNVVLLNYDLCPQVTIDIIALQMTQAMRWLYRELRAQGRSTQQVVVAGHSAGGQLAALLMTCDWQQVDRDMPPHWVSRGLGISGVYELEAIWHTPSLQADLHLTRQSARRLSPARFPAPEHGVFVATVGARESIEFIGQTRLLAQRWGARAVPVCDIVPGRRHFDILDDLANPGQSLHGRARELLGLSYSSP